MTARVTISAVDKIIDLIADRAIFNAILAVPAKGYDATKRALVTEVLDAIARQMHEVPVSTPIYDDMPGPGQVGALVFYKRGDECGVW